MKFELEPFHQNISDEELLNDLKRTIQKDGLNDISQKEYDRIGTYSSSTIKRRFNGWNIALKKAGINIRNAQNIPNEELLADLRRVANENKLEGISQEEYNKWGFYSSTVIKRRFKKWNSALDLAGVKIKLLQNISKEKLFENLEELWIKLGRQPHLSDMVQPVSKYSGKTYKSRFGTWRKALEQFVQFINAEVIETEQTIANKPGLLSNLNTVAKYIPHKTKREVSLRLRFLVMRRDNFKCKICGKTPATSPGVELHVDHMLAWSRGGETIYENLQTLCSVCNIGKSDLELTQN